MPKLLTINLLGDLEILRDGRPQALPPSRKTRALLAYLVGTSRSHRRSRLCHLLWDVADDPRAALRWSLTKIRPLLDDPGHPRLVADRDSVRFDAGTAEVDLAAVRACLAPGTAALDVSGLEQAAARFRGEFLEGLELPDFHDFQVWSTAMREETRNLQGSILRELVARLEGNPESALPFARTWTASDPLSETARGSLIRLLASARRFQEAEEELHAGRKLLAELGGRAGDYLGDAERDLRERRASPSRAALGTPTPAPSAVRIEEVTALTETLTPLVGRDAECRRLTGLLDQVVDRRREVVVLLRGEPGIGKSRLLTELASRVTERRGTVLEGRSYEAETSRPYGPWIDALTGLHRAALGATLVPELAPLLPGVDLGERDRTRDRFFAAAVELVAARAHSAPPVLLSFDDLQWCDDASVELLHYMLRMNRHRPVLVLLAARDGELPDNERALRLVRSLRRDELLQDLMIGPLGPEATATLARSISPDVDAERVYRRSAGNPLFAVELARAGGSRRSNVGTGLAELVRDRLDRLSPGVVELLRWGAVLGGSIGPRLLADLVEQEFPSLLESLTLLEKHGLLRVLPSAVAEPGGYTFAHDIVRRVVYGDLSGPRRRLMHDRVAEVLASRVESEPRLAPELARHAGLGSDPARAAAAALAAGRHSLRVFANREAVALARRAVRHAESLPDPQRLRLTIEAREVELRARRPDDVEAEALELTALAERALEAGAFEHARLGFHLVSHLRWEQGDWPGAHRHMLRAEHVGRSGDDQAQVVAMAEAARCLALLERDLGEAEALALEARSRASRAGIEATAIPHALGLLRFHRGEWDEAAEFFGQARAQYLRGGDRVGEFQALEHQIVLELERGRPDAALALTVELAPLGEKLREGSDAPCARVLAALAELAVGRGDQARLDHALEELRMADAKQRLAYTLTRAAALDLQAGEVDRARRRASEALAAAQALGHASEVVMAHVVLGRIAHAVGDAPGSAASRNALTEDALRAASAHVRGLAVEWRDGPVKPGRSQGWSG